MKSKKANKTRAKNTIAQNLPCRQTAVTLYVVLTLIIVMSFQNMIFIGKHITDIYITETGTTELENLSHNIIDIFIIKT